MSSVTKIGNASSSQIIIKLNTTGIDKIKKMLVENKYAVQVGILGEKAADRKKTVTNKAGKHKAGKQSSSQTNAEIGLIHEKGSLSRNIPRRSFLEMPLKQKLPLQSSVIRTAMLEALEKGHSIFFYQTLGLISEKIVLSAFNSAGFGSWPANSARTIARKGSSMPLIDTGQLRKSISHRVVER